MSRIKGNKGEWSELYVFLELLASGRLYAADEDLNKLNGIYFPILKILRSEEENIQSEYKIKSDKKVELFVNDRFVKSIDSDLLSKYALTIYTRIKQGAEHAFEIEEANEIVSDINCTKIKAPSSDKTDITLQLLDINTGYNPICGFSVKSELGSAPTLLNASGATNIQYNVIGIDDSEMDRINAIDSKTKILDRIERIQSKGTIRFSRIKNETFANNLMLIDSYMDDILSEMLLYQYSTGKVNCKDVIEAIEEKNPLGYPQKGYYKYKFKKFLCSVALGMTPSTTWNGKDEANGGYIVVTTSGDVLAYHIYNRDCFEDYLFNNTKFERGSTARHKYASIYKEDGNYYIDLNLQIRFIK